MPLFDFRCRVCQQEFEALVRPAVTPACPACGASDLDRLPSGFAVSSAERRGAAALKARRKAATAAAHENIATEREIDRHRREDH